MKTEHAADKAHTIGEIHQSIQKNMADARLTPEYAQEEVEWIGDADGVLLPMHRFVGQYAKEIADDHNAAIAAEREKFNSQEQQWLSENLKLTDELATEREKATYWELRCRESRKQLTAERERGQQECNRLDAFWQNEVARQLAAEREKWKAKEREVFTDNARYIEQLREQLAKAQAAIAKKDAALDWLLSDNFMHKATDNVKFSAAINARNLKSDTTALDAAIAEAVKKARAELWQAVTSEGAKAVFDKELASAIEQKRLEIWRDAPNQPDIQEAVIAKLDLVHRHAIAAAQHPLVDALKEIRIGAPPMVQRKIDDAIQ